MKILFVTIFVHFIVLNLCGQHSLGNSNWDATTTVPRTINLRLEFKKDSFFIFLPNGREAELSYFQQQNDSLLIKKLRGVTPCSSDEVWYRIEWLDNGKKFLLRNLTDSCSQRSNSWTGMRINEKIKPSDQ